MSTATMMNHPAPVSAATARAAGWALMRTEARLLLRSVTVWGGATLALALGVVRGWTRMPTWESFAQNAGAASLVLAGALLLLGHLAASRDHRHDATELTAALPAPPARRRAALLVVVPVALLVAALVTGVHLLSLAPHWPAGPRQLAQVGAAVVVPALGALLGVAAGRRLPATAAGPMTLATAAAVVFLLPAIGNGESFVGTWLAPVVLRNNEIPGLPQPHGWHLLYLLTLLGVTAALVLLRRGRLRWAVTAALTAVVAALTVIPQTRAVPEVITSELLDRYAGPSTLHCQTHTAVRYCALPGFDGWVPLWREAVEPVAAVLPAAAVGHLPVVRQNGTGEVPDPAEVPRVVETDLIWGRHGRWAADSRAALATAYAHAAVGLPGENWLPSTGSRSGTGTGSDLVEFRCSGAGQARTVIALWLAAHALPDGERRLAGHALSLSPVDYGQPEIDAATALLRLPEQRVRRFLDQSWTAATAAGAGPAVLGTMGIAGLARPTAEVTACR